MDPITGREQEFTIKAAGFNGVARVMSMLQSRRYEVCVMHARSEASDADVWCVDLTVRSGEPEAELLQRRLDRLPTVLSVQHVGVNTGQ